MIPDIWLVRLNTKEEEGMLMFFNMNLFQDNQSYQQIYLGRDRQIHLKQCFPENEPIILFQEEKMVGSSRGHFKGMKKGKKTS